MTAEDLYRHMCAFAHDHGWERVSDAEGGWWWNPEAQGGQATLGELIEDELRECGVDLRLRPAVVIEQTEPGTMNLAGTTPDQRPAGERRTIRMDIDITIEPDDTPEQIEAKIAEAFAAVKRVHDA